MFYFYTTCCIWMQHEECGSCSDLLCVISLVLHSAMAGARLNYMSKAIITNLTPALNFNMMDFK